MDIKELESFSLADAVKFHDELNPALWTEKGQLDPEVHDRLMDIARDFMAYLGLSSLKVEDITISGSNAAYSYTPHSDLDLHILVDHSKLPDDEVYKELFNAKKTIYNDTHDIKVHGVPVELYVQDSNQPHHSLGEYSILKKDWIKMPVKRRANFDQSATKAKYEKLGELLELAIKTRSLKRVDKVLDVIKRYRKAGLESTGEFGPENLAFKALRKQGLIQKLWDLRNELRSEKLSLEDYDPNGPPPGPEFKPTMPKGTVRVDVSDVYDWYKLGQHISNMKGLGKHDFGKGPPSTILSFGDEDLEHQYIQALKKTGLDTTDIDPKGHEPMKGQKVDPTYNVGVAEAFDKPYPFKWEKSMHGDYDALVKLPDGTNLSIMFNGEYKNHWMVEFYRSNSQEITGEGDAQRIFATVLHAIQQFIKKKKPKSIYFTAVKEDDPKGSRTKLYNRLVQRFASGLGYTLTTQADDYGTSYKLVRIKDVNKGVAEGMDILDPFTRNVLNRMEDDSWLSAEHAYFITKGIQKKHQTNPDAYNQEIQRFIDLYKKYKGQQGVAEGGAETSWSDGNEKITLQDILELTKHIKQIDLPIDDKLKSKLIHWDGNPEEIERINQVTVSKQFPILVMLDGQGQIDWILDGNHRLHKAIKSQAKTIPAKLIRPSDLDDRTRRVFHIEEQGVAEDYKKVEGGWHHYGLGYGGRREGIQPLPRYNQFITMNRHKEGTASDIYHYMRFLSNKDFMQDVDITGEEIANALAKLGGTNPKTELQNFNKEHDTQLKSWNRLWDFVVKKRMDDHRSEMLRLESASGYIPSKKQANDPRFKTALTVDIKPDSIMKNAKAFGSKVSRAGIPPKAKTNGKF